MRLDQPVGTDRWTTAEWTRWLDEAGAVTSILPSDSPICGRCRRPMQPRDDGFVFPNCWACNNTYRGMSRVVVPISYSGSSGLTSLIGQAKDHPERWWIRYGLASLLYSFLAEHVGCLERFAHGTFDYATVVPSHPSRRGGRDHLKDLVQTVPSQWPRVPWNLDLLTKTRPSVADDRRAAIEEGLFVSDPRVNLAGRRVLLVDDLYTSGSTTGSAAHALREAGADPPVIVTIGRHLSSDDAAAVNFVRANDLSARRYTYASCVVHDRSPSPFASLW